MQGTSQIQKLNYSDLVGVVASGLCAIHCALTPMVFVARPLLEGTMGAHSHGPGFWALLDYLFLILSLVAVWFSAKHTTHSGIKRVLWIAWIVFSIGLLSETFYFHQGKWLMYIGSIVLVLAHAYNHRFCRKVKLDVPPENSNR